MSKLHQIHRHEGLGLETIIEQRKHERLELDSKERELGQGLVSKVLVKDGEWQVPPDARPRGWENMGVRELCLCSYDAMCCPVHDPTGARD